METSHWILKIKNVVAQSIYSFITYRIHTNFLACSYKVYRLCHSTCWQLLMTSKLPILTMCCVLIRPPNKFTFASVLKNKITVTNNIIKHYTLLTNSNDTMSQYLLDSSCVFILVLWKYIFSLLVSIVIFFLLHSSLICFMYSHNKVYMFVWHSLYLILCTISTRRTQSANHCHSDSVMCAFDKLRQLPWYL